MGEDKTDSGSVIDIVQKMVQEGQPREKILSTLKDLGVNDEQSKRLLLIAEADTFTLLKKEIGSLVSNEFKSNREHFDEIIRKEISNLEEREKQKVYALTKAELVETKQEVMQESKNFKERVNVLINSSEKTVSLVKKGLDSLNKKVSKIDLEVEQLKIHKFRKKSLLFSYSMLALGAILLLISILLFIFNFNSLDITQMIMIAVVSLSSVALMFASIVS
jgi:hypothetical protein